MQELVLSGWGDENMAFPAMFAHLFLPESTPQMRQCYAELQKQEREQGGREPLHDDCSAT